MSPIHASIDRTRHNRIKAEKTDKSQTNQIDDLKYLLYFPHHTFPLSQMLSLWIC